MCKTLLVDDNADFRTALHEALGSRFPFSQLVAADGFAYALRSAAELRPNLVMVDLVLGDGNGLELVRRLRAMDATTAIAVLTIHDLPEYREEALRSGANEFFPKLSTSVPDIFRYVETILATRLRVLAVCGEHGLSDLLAGLLARRWPDILDVRTTSLEEGLASGRLLKPQLVLFHAKDDAERERVYCQALRLGCRGTGMRLVCMRNGPSRGRAPLGADDVLSTAADFENELARIVERVRSEQFLRPLSL